MKKSKLKRQLRDARRVIKQLLARPVRYTVMQRDVVPVAYTQCVDTHLFWPPDTATEMTQIWKEFQLQAAHELARRFVENGLVRCSWNEDPVTRRIIFRAEVDVLAPRSALRGGPWN